jgi:hypothetical protein
MLLCAIGVAALAACGNPDVQPAEPLAAPPASAVTTPAATSAPKPTPSAVPQSLAFSAPQVGGGTIDMAEYAGQPVLMWFWAPT